MNNRSPPNCSKPSPTAKVTRQIAASRRQLRKLLAKLRQAVANSESYLPNCGKPSPTAKVTRQIEASRRQRRKLLAKLRQAIANCESYSPNCGKPSPTAKATCQTAASLPSPCTWLKKRNN